MFRYKSRCHNFKENAILLTVYYRFFLRNKLQTIKIEIATIKIETVTIKMFCIVFSGKKMKVTPKTSRAN